MLGAERRLRWSYDEKVRLVEETLQPGETVCGVARRHGVTHSLPFAWRRQARQGDWAEMLRLLLFPSRSHLHGHRHRSARRNWRLRLLRNAQGQESSRSSLAAVVVFALIATSTLRRCSRFLSSCEDDDSDSERRQGLDRDRPHRYAPRHANPGSYRSGEPEARSPAGDLALLLGTAEALLDNFYDGVNVILSAIDHKFRRILVWLRREEPLAPYPGRSTARSQIPASHATIRADVARSRPKFGQPCAALARALPNIG